MDLLSELEELIAPAETAESIDFAGSLEYIDSLANRSPLLRITKSQVLRARDAAAISNAFFDKLDFPQALPRDNRQFNFNQPYDPGSLNPGSAEIQDILPDIRPASDPWKWERRYIEKLKNPGSPFFRRQDNSVDRSRRGGGIRFADPFRTYICVKRKIRREIMHAFGLSGRYYGVRHLSPYSFVRC